MQLSRYSSVLFICSVFLLGACGHSSLATREESVHILEEYRMIGGETISVTVYDEPSFSGTFIVNDTARFSYPLIGSISVKDKTAMELETLLTNRLSQKYVNNPNVNVTITGYPQFYIIGEVSSQGAYEYQPRLDITSAVAIAGGFTIRADRRDVLIRNHFTGTHATYDIRNDTIFILPGDIITVSPRYF